MIKCMNVCAISNLFVKEDNTIYESKYTIIDPKIIKVEPFKQK